MYQWLLGVLGALLAAARRPAPPPAPAPAPAPRCRPRPSVQPPVEDPDEAQPKNQKSDADASERKEKVPEVSSVVKLPTKAKRKRHASWISETAHETESTTPGPAPKRPARSAAEVEMLQIDKMPCGTNTCLNKETLSLSYKTSTRSGNIKPVPDSILTLRPPIKEHTGPGSTNLEAGRIGRLFCTAEEYLQRGEKEKYKQLLQLIKEKYPGSRPQPQLARFRTYCTAVENSYEQGRAVKQAIGGRQNGEELSEEALPRLAVAPTVYRLPPDLAVEEQKFPSSDRPAERFPPLTEAMEREISAAFGKGEPDEIMSSAFKLKVTREDIQTLDNLRWLNDEVINFYMILLMERSKKEGYPAVHAFSTFFYPKLTSGGHAAVRRWTKGVDLFKQDLVLVPVHLRSHWTLAVIDMRKKAIKYYDSLGQKRDKICETLFKYLQEESREKRKMELVFSEWTFHSMEPHEIPQQLNGSDCGVFVCTYADYVARDRAMTFTQDHMPYFRKKMVWEIIHQQLL